MKQHLDIITAYIIMALLDILHQKVAWNGVTSKKTSDSPFKLKPHFIGPLWRQPYMN